MAGTNDVFVLETIRVRTRLSWPSGVRGSRVRGAAKLASQAQLRRLPLFASLFGIGCGCERAESGAVRPLTNVRERSSHGPGWRLR
jgi:hypothetical protein